MLNSCHIRFICDWCFLCCQSYHSKADFECDGKSRRSTVGTQFTSFFSRSLSVTPTARVAGPATACQYHSTTG